MVDGGKSCFRSSERKVVSTPPLRADFTQQSSPRSSHGPLRKTNLCRAFLQQEVSHRFMFTHKTYCLFNCWLYGIGIRFSPNNLKRKARCGSDLLGAVQVYGSPEGPLTIFFVFCFYFSIFSFIHFGFYLLLFNYIVFHFTNLGFCF